MSRGVGMPGRDLSTQNGQMRMVSPESADPIKATIRAVVNLLSVEYGLRTGHGQTFVVSFFVKLFVRYVLTRSSYRHYSHTAPSSYKML